MQILLTIILLVFCATPAISAGDALRVTELTGAEASVKVTGKDKAVRAVKVSGSVQLGDEIATVKGQTARIVSDDGHEWRVGPDSLLTLEARRTEGLSAYWVLSLMRGSFWGKAEKDPKAKDSFRIKIRTRFAALGVRGTEYLLAIDDKQAKTDVLEGTVMWGPSMTFTKDSYKEVKSGEHGELKADGKPVVTPTKGNPFADYGMPAPGSAEAKPAAPEGVSDKCPRSRGTRAQCEACGDNFRGMDGTEGTCFEKCPRRAGNPEQCKSCGQAYAGNGGVGVCD